MKKNWEIKKLREICDFGNGLWTGKKPPYINVGVIRNTNFTKEGTLDDADIVFLDVEQSQFAKRRLKLGDIILEKSGGGPKQPVGRVIVFNKKDGNYSFSNFTSVIRIKNTKQADFNYLHRFLFFSYISGVTETMQSHSTGIRNLKFDDYKDIEAPLPPLPEQQRIVAALDEAFAAIAKAKANAEQNLKNARELFESYSQNVFANRGEGWEEKKLKQVCEYEKNQNSHKNLPYVGLEHIESNTGNFLGSFEPQEVKSATFQFNEQHVLYGRLRPYLNKVLLPNFKGHCSTEIFPIKVGKQIIRDFLFYWLIAGTTVKKIDATWTGARMPRANMNQVLEFDFAFPSKQEQVVIVSKLKDIQAETHRLETIYQQKLNDLEELKKSILQKAFSGELKTT